MILELLVDCPACGLTFPGSWHVPDASSLEEMVEPPEAEQECPECAHRWVEEYSGWAFFNEA